MSTKVNGVWRAYQSDGTEGYPGYFPVPREMDLANPNDQPHVRFGRNAGEDSRVSRIVFEDLDGVALFQVYVAVDGLVIPARGQAGVNFSDGS